MKTPILSSLVVLAFLSSTAYGQTRENPVRGEPVEVTATPPRSFLGSLPFRFHTFWAMDGGSGGRGGLPNRGDDEDVRDAAEKDCDEQAGNPIVLATGNKIESSLDFSSAGEMGLYLRRTYNHYWIYPGLFGRHWVSNFDYSLVPVLAQGIVWAQRPDGRRIKFLWNTTRQRYEEDKAAPVAYIVANPGGGFTHHSEDHMVETYDTYGYVQTVTNRQGIGWTFSYVNNYLQTVTHTSGRSVSFTWTGNRLTRVTDPDGAQFDYSYTLHAFGTDQHRLASVTLPGSSGTPASPATTITYHHEKPTFPGALTGVSYAGVRYSTFDYDSQGRAISSQHTGPAGAVEVNIFAYTGSSTPPSNPPPFPPPPGGDCDPMIHVCIEPRPSSGPEETGLDATELAHRQQVAQTAQAILSQPLAMTDVTHTNPLGKQTAYTLDDGQITNTDGLASANCPATWTQRTYDSRGYPGTLTDAKGHTHASTFNDQGQPQTIVEAQGTAVARTTTFDWDVANNRPDMITIQDDHRRSFAYWPDHRIKSVTLRNLSAFGTLNQDHTTSYSYTLHGNGLVATSVEDGPLTGTGDAITHSYSAQGDLIQVKNSLNHTITYSQHNGRGQPGRIVGINGEAVEYDYDARGRVRAMRTYRNAGTQTTTFAYAASGLLDSRTTPDGVTESYTYDSARRLKTITRNTPDGNQVRERFYDAASNVIQEDVHLGGILITRTYTDHDELNRVIGQRGNNGQHTTFQYDLNGNLSHIVRTLGQTTEFEYDALNRLSQQTDAELGITAFQYDTGDRIVQVSDPRNRLTSWQYDGFGQLWQYNNPDTGLTTQQWNAQGQRTSATRADGITLSYGYDPLGRPTSVTAGSGAQAQTHTTVWDSSTNCTHGKGRICRIDDPYQSLELGYTAYGELSLQRPTIEGQLGYLHRFQYDALGRLSQIEYPGNLFVNYSHTLDQISAINATIGGLTHTVASDIGFSGNTTDNQGLVYHTTHGNGRHHDELFDIDGRMFGIATGKGQGLGYAFDHNDRIKQKINFANTQWSQTYDYDDLDRLTSVSSSGDNQGLGYDASGNRLWHTTNAATSTYAIAATSNRINTISGNLSRTYSYKATGQVSSITGALSLSRHTTTPSGTLPAGAQPSNTTALFADGFESAGPPTGTFQFSYDRFNRLDGITGPGINASYKVAATGMRVAKTANGQTTRFVYSLNGQLLHEHDTATNRRTQHIYLHGKPIALVRDNTLYWVHTDHLGRPELVANQSGTTVWRARLSAFNRSVVTDTIDGYHLGFPGQYHDNESGFAYNIHRDYDPATGRYLQSDPIGMNGGINTYVYASSNPIGRIDPLGLKDYSECESLDLLADARIDMSQRLDRRIVSAISNHTTGGKFDFRVNQKSDTFNVDGRLMSAPEFGNYIAGYSGIYFGGRPGLAGVIMGGVYFDFVDAVHGVANFDMDADSVLDIYRGAFRAKQEQRGKELPAMCMCRSGR